VKKVAADFANFAMLQTKVRPEYSPLSPLIGFSPPPGFLAGSVWLSSNGKVCMQLRARKRADETDGTNFTMIKMIKMIKMVFHPIWRLFQKLPGLKLPSQVIPRHRQERRVSVIRIILIFALHRVVGSP